VPPVGRAATGFGPNGYDVATLVSGGFRFCPCDPHQHRSVFNPDRIAYQPAVLRIYSDATVNDIELPEVARAGEHSTLQQALVQGRACVGALVEKSVYVAVDVDEQNGDAIDLAGNQIALPDLIKLDHRLPIVHVVSSLSVLLNTRKSEQRLTPESRLRCNLTMGRGICC